MTSKFSKYSTPKKPSFKKDSSSSYVSKPRSPRSTSSSKYSKSEFKIIEDKSNSTISKTKVKSSRITAFGNNNSRSFAKTFENSDGGIQTQQKSTKSFAKKQNFKDFDKLDRRTKRDSKYGDSKFTSKSTFENSEFGKKNPSVRRTSSFVKGEHVASFGGSPKKTAPKFTSRFAKETMLSNNSEVDFDIKNSKQSTSWGNVANWYQKMVSETNSYQNKVILPNLLELLDIKAHQKILDLGCGVGFFAQKYHEKGVAVTGVDIGAELIAIAKTETDPKIEYIIGSADKITKLKDSSFDSSSIVLAIQNMQNGEKVVKEICRVTRNKVVIVLNHPFYRQPKFSSWEWDSKNQVQYRRVDRYLTQYQSSIVMNPGNITGSNSRFDSESKDSKDVTFSFHRPLSWYINEFSGNNFSLTSMKELISHIPADQGPVKTPKLEQSRKEIPLFMTLVFERKS
jgi:ubiquinone/menaquinone biosynthesis C-methylase UbiE